MSSVRGSLAEYAASLSDEIVVVIDRNRPVVAIVPLKNVDRESIALSGHPEFLRLIARSRADFAAGRRPRSSPARETRTALPTEKRARSGKNRECCTDNGTSRNSVSATGAADAPVGHQSDPTMAALFCIGPTSSGAVNSVAALPGPGRLQRRRPATAATATSGAT